MLAFAAPQFLWLLLGVPLVILLHFIRKRRVRREVSALFLWRQARELAARKRRFSPSWLLLMQILFVALASLALAQPFWRDAGPPERIIIIDASASMAAQDSDGVRLSKAFQQAEPLIREASRVAVVRAGLDVTVVQPLTENVSDAANALRTIQAADAGADLGRALSVARSISPEAELHLFTDSEPPQDAQLRVHPVGNDALNIGIITFDIGIQQAFIAVASNHPRPQEVTLELYRDDSLIAQTNLLIPTQGQSNTTFPLTESSGFFEARVITPDWDALPLDDRAFAGRRDLRVVLDAPNQSLERALAAMPNTVYQVRPNVALDVPGVDVFILTRELPEDARGRFVLLSPPAESPEFKIIRQWDRSEPLLRFVDLTETIVGVAPELRFEEAAPWQVLARSSDLTPLILSQQNRDRRVVALNFHPSQTDMINRSAFPLFVANVVNSFREEARLPLGSPLPDGAVALTPGVFEVAGEQYTASLLSRTETQLPSNMGVISETTAEPTPAEGVVSERVRSVALWLVVLATFLLLSEWLLFSRNNRGWSFGFRRQG
jgi:hypothetical protein